MHGTPEGRLRPGADAGGRSFLPGAGCPSAGTTDDDADRMSLEAL